MSRRIRRLRIKKPEFYQIAAALFGIGIFAGIFLARGVHSSCPAETSRFFQQIGANLEGGTCNYTVLFQEIVGNRLKSIGLLMIFSVSIFSLPYIGGFLLYKGCISGFLAGSVLFQFGTKGMLLAVSLFFPQCFFYVPAYFSLLNKSYRFGTEGINKREVMKEVPYVFMMLALLIVGCILEAYINTWILGKVFPVL